MKQDMFANDREIQAQIVLNSVLQQKSSKGKVAISLELFDLFAAIEIVSMHLCLCIVLTDLLRNHPMHCSRRH